MKRILTIFMILFFTMVLYCTYLTYVNSKYFNSMQVLNETNKILYADNVILENENNKLNTKVEEMKLEKQGKKKKW